MMNLDKLKDKALSFRQDIFKLVIEAKKGHYPSCSSLAEFLVYLFNEAEFNYNSHNIDSSDRDRLIISKGHAAMALYPFLIEKGIISQEQKHSFCKKNGLLRMYADPSIPGVDTVTGSLGNGYGISAGIAFDAKRKSYKNRIFSVLGDGECYEGSIWETAMFVAHHKLNNLITVIDRNNLCIMGETEDCIELESLDAKWKAFGFEVLRINGHSFEEIDESFLKMNNSDKPICLILDTIKGKGISFMENQPLWHNRIPEGEFLKIAKKELMLS